VSNIIVFMALLFQSCYLTIIEFIILKHMPEG
jgi:hypothetical protein